SAPPGVGPRRRGAGDLPGRECLRARASWRRRARGGDGWFKNRDGAGRLRASDATTCSGSSPIVADQVDRNDYVWRRDELSSTDLELVGVHFDGIPARRD